MWFWLRRLVRNVSPPIQRPAAEKWHFRLSLLYGFLTWNALGFVVYMFFTGHNDWLKDMKEEAKEEPPSVRFAQLLGIKKAHVIQVSGFKKVGEYDIDNTQEEEEEEDDATDAELSPDAPVKPTV